MIACARIAAALHRSSIPSARPAPSPTRSTGCGQRSTALAPLAPALATSLHRRLAAIGDLGLERTGAARRRPRGLRPFAGPLRRPDHRLVDFDAVCLAEPALDLGSFTGHLAVAARRAQDAAGRPPTDGEDLGVRVPPRVPAAERQRRPRRPARPRRRVPDGGARPPRRPELVPAQAAAARPRPGPPGRTAAPHPRAVTPGRRASRSRLTRRGRRSSWKA